PVLSGQRTVTVAVAVLSPSDADGSFVALTFAVFETTPQVETGVVATTWTEKLAPDASDVRLQVRTPLAIEHSDLSGDSVQVIPAGSVSVIFTPYAVPAPLFVIKMSNQICCQG